jgi:hypothetical protein
MVSNMSLLKNFLTITFIALLLTGFSLLLRALVITTKYLFVTFNNFCFDYFNNPIVAEWFAIGVPVFFICFVTIVILKKV